MHFEFWRVDGGLSKRGQIFFLKSVADIISTWIVLYNLCIITKDKFDLIQIKKLR